MNDMRRRGFSLVTVLVSSALLGTLALVFTSMMRSTQKGQTSVRNAADFETLKSTVAMILGNRAKCATAFWNSAGTAAAKYSPTGTVSATESFGSLRLGSSTVAAAGLDLGAGLTLTGLSLEPVAGIAPDTTSIPGHVVHSVALTLEAAKSQDSIGAKTLSNASNPFRFEIVTDSSEFVVDCRGAANSTAVVTASAARVRFTGIYASKKVDFMTKAAYPMTLAPGVSNPVATWASSTELYVLSAPPGSSTSSEVRAPFVEIPAFSWDGSSFYGIGCNGATGWTLSGCMLSVSGAQENNLTVPNGCISNTWADMTILGIVCVRR